MKFHVVFIVAAIAFIWFAAFSGSIEMFWVRAIGVLFCFFGFLFVVMLTDIIGDGIRAFGGDLVVIGIALLIVWV